MLNIRLRDRIPVWEIKRKLISSEDVSWAVHRGKWDWTGHTVGLGEMDI